MHTSEKLSIIIPVFNEEKTIGNVIHAIAHVFNRSIVYEIIVVNDGSYDQTKKEIDKAIKNYPNIHLITHQTNRGKGQAIKSALQKATGEYVVIQDADLEYNPEDIPRLFSLLKKNKKAVVYGTRLKRMPHIMREEKTPLFFLHFCGNRFLSLVTSLLYGQWITDMETCYKLFPRETALQINLRAKGFAFEPEITAKLIKKGFRILEAPIVTNPRDYKQGKKLRTFHDGPIALWTLIKYRFLD